jgi:hypothetical protein
MSSTEEQVRQIAASVNTTIVRRTEKSITTIVSIGIPILLAFLNKCMNNPTPEEAQAAVKERWESGPRARKRMLADSARRLRRQRKERISKDESFEIARATIEHVINGDSQQIAEACRELIPTDDVDGEDSEGVVDNDDDEEG